MKPAATDLIDILYGDRETVPQFWVGVVPYAASVNIGTQHEDWLTATTPTTTCRPNGRAASRRAPSRTTATMRPPTSSCFGRFAGRPPSNSTRILSGARPATWPWSRARASATPTRATSSICRAGRPARRPRSGAQRDHAQHLGALAERRQRVGSERPNPRSSWTTTSIRTKAPDPNLGCGPAITPLVSSKTTILVAIDDMAPWHRGVAPWRTSGSPGAGACCRRTGAAGGTATCRMSCRSTTRRPTWRRSSFS